MAASRSKSRPRRNVKKKATPSLTAARAPWVRDGIDYGPARVALGDLATWAFDLARAQVVDWPMGEDHVERARRFVLGTLAQKRVGDAPIEALMFTANLLARTFDADLGLDLSDALAIFEYLGLPSEVLPLFTPRPRRPATPLRTVPVRIPTPAVDDKRPTVRIQPPPLRFCDDCGYVHEVGDHLRYRNAA